VSSSDILYAALAEVLHYIALTGWFPGDYRTVSPTLRHAERAVLRAGLVERAVIGWQLTDMGAAWLHAWGQPEPEAVGVAA